MSFSAMRRKAAATTELAEQAEADESHDAAPKLAVASLAAGASPDAIETAVTSATTVTIAPASLDDELAAVAVARDINSEPVAPPTQTEAESEKEATAEPAPVGGDPILPAEPNVEANSGVTRVGGLPHRAAPPASEGVAAAESASAEPNERTAEETAEPAPFKIDEEELRGYGIDKATIDTIAGLNIERARDVIAEIRSKNSAVNDLQKKKADLENEITARRVSTPGGGGIFAAVAHMFRGPSSETKALRLTDGELGKIQDYLSNDNIRNRVHTLRRQEIVDAASSLSLDNRRLSAASKAFNAALLATPAGRAFETEIESITAQHAELDRRKIIAMHMDGTLAAKIGTDPLTPHVRQAFQDDRVKQAWEKMRTAGDAIEKRGEMLADRLKAYEEHFPGAVDGERLREEVSKAMQGVEKTFGEAVTQNPDDERQWMDRMRKLAKAIQEFVEKLLSMFRKSPGL